MGSDERIFYVHRGTLEGHPAFDARLKASTDEYEDAIDWSGFDEQTIDCVLNFLYTRGYQAPQTTSVAVEEDEADAGEEAPAQDGEEEQQEEQEVVVDEADEADEEDGNKPSPCIIRSHYQRRIETLIQNQPMQNNRHHLIAQNRSLHGHSHQLQHCLHVQGHCRQLQSPP